MTYQEIYASVVSLTNHPEMAAEIATAIQAATLKMHQIDFYIRDSTEKLIVLEQEGYIFSIDVTQVFPRYRAVRWIRKWNPVGRNQQTQQDTGAAGVFFDVTDPESIIDGYGYVKPNQYYVAGNSLNIRSDTLIKRLLMSWYQMPKILPTAEYSSWIAEVVPFAIIFDAASTIFQTIAQQDQARKYDNLVMEQLIMIKQHGILSKGY